VRLHVSPARPARGILPWATLLVLFVVELVLVCLYLPLYQGRGGECGCGFPRMLEHIPYAGHADDFDGGPIVSIEPDSLGIDGRREPRTEQGLRELADELTRLRRNFELLQSGDRFPGTYVFLIDGRTPYGVIRWVSRAAAESGYERPQYVVRSFVWGVR
jgi:hypothetical protein